MEVQLALPFSKIKSRERKYTGLIMRGTLNQPSIMIALLTRGIEFLSE
jgi:hypothetical protein